MIETLEFWAGFLASLATIGGVAYGVLRYLAHQRAWRDKVRAVERYLETKARRPDPGTTGLHSTTHLMRHVGLPEDDILRICFESDVIEQRAEPDAKGKAGRILFGHVARSGDGTA